MHTTPLVLQLLSSYRVMCRGAQTKSTCIFLCNLSYKLQEHVISSRQLPAIGGSAVQHICHDSPFCVYPHSAGLLVSGLQMVA